MYGEWQAPDLIIGDDARKAYDAWARRFRAKTQWARSQRMLIGKVVAACKEVTREKDALRKEMLSMQAVLSERRRRHTKSQSQYAAKKVFERKQQLRIITGGSR
jgi:hypothetical protein